MRCHRVAGSVAPRAAPGSSSLGPSWDRDGPRARGRSLRRPRRCSIRHRATRNAGERYWLGIVQSEGTMWIHV